MIKRFLAYCLMVSMLIGNVSVFSSENDYEGTNYEIPTKVLNTFNIISLNEDGNLNVGSKISRAEFAVMIAKALGADLNLPQSGEVYSDLKKGTDAYNAVVIVSKLGIVSGYGDGTFRPYDSITFEQAASMLTKMIGYKLMVDAKGGYPVGCLAVASETGILKGVDISSGQVTNANAVLMLYNAMCADMFKQTQFGTNEKYSVSKDVNVFSEYLGVSKKKGIVTENDKTSLIGESKISKGEVTISGVVYNAGKSGIEKYLGYCVEFFATADDEQNEILLAYAVESENNVETIEAENLSIENSSLAKGYFSYFDENDKIKKVYVSKEVDVIYNSRAYPSFKESDFDITVGELVFMDNNNDGYAESIVFFE